MLAQQTSHTKLAAIYVRQSRTGDTAKDKQKREQQVETTLDTQAAACKKEAAKRGYKVGEVFSERYTGAEMWDRPRLTELRARIKANEFDALIVYSTDRLARDPIHIGLVLEECQRHNCELIFVTEPLEDSPEGKLILYVRGWAAQIERIRIKDRMARGRNAIIAAGKLTCNGHPAFGYRFDPATRSKVIDEEQAAVVRQIFQWTIDGMSTHGVVTKLRQMGIPTPAEFRGKQTPTRTKPVWGCSTVGRILADEQYTGKTFVNRYKVGDQRAKNTGQYRSVRADKKDWKAMPDELTPAIISTETFIAARNAVSKHSRRADYTRNRTRPVLLRGLIYCANCDHTMHAMWENTYNKDNPQRATYRCSARNLKSAIVSTDARASCRAKRLIAAPLEEAVWSKVVSFFFDPKLVEGEVEKALTALPDTNLTSEAKAIEKRLTGARRLRDVHLSKYEEAVAEGDTEMATTFEQKYKTANIDVRALTSALDDINTRLAAYQNAGKTAKAFAKQLRTVMAGVKGEFTFEEKRAALLALNTRVYAADGMPTRIRLTIGAFDENSMAPSRQSKSSAATANIKRSTRTTQVSHSSMVGIEAQLAASNSLTLEVYA